MSDEFMRDPPAHDPSLAFRLTADDLLSDLAWPKLFLAPRLAFRPSRIGLGIAVVLVLSLLDQLLARIIGGGGTLTETLAFAVTDSVGLAGDRLAALDAGGALTVFVLSLGDMLWSMWENAPLLTAPMLPLTLLGLAFGSVAIGRLSAEEFARGRAGSWVDGLRWAVQGFGGIAVAYLLPLVIAGLLVGVLAVGAWALLSIPFVNVVGAVVGVLGLLLALACVVVLIGYAFGMPLFAAAVAVEGSDGIDAMHRSYAYLFARPARFVGYGVLLIVQGVVVVSVLGAIAALTVSLGIWAESLLLGERAALVASGVTGADDRLGAGGQVAARVMHTVLQLPALLVTGYAVAYWASGSTMLYLVLRRLIDGQDMVDIHVPGEIDAKMDEILSRRGEVIKRDADPPA